MADQATGLVSPLLRRWRVGVVRPLCRGRVLDYGCGSGTLAGEFAPVDYLGVDTDAAALAEARARWPEHCFTTSAELTRAAGSFDTAVSMAVIEHVPDPATMLVELAEALRPGGRVVLTTPSPASSGLHRAGAKLGLFSRAAAAEHRQFLSRARVEECGRRAGFRVLRYRRFMLGLNQLVVLGRGDGR